MGATRLSSCGPLSSFSGGGWRDGSCCAWREYSRGTMSAAQSIASTREDTFRPAMFMEHSLAPLFTVLDPRKPSQRRQVGLRGFPALASGPVTATLYFFK